VNALPAAVERVARFLREARVEARLEELSEDASTAEAAAEAAGCRPAQIVKSLVFACDARWVLVMIPGDARADRTKVAAAAACGRARIAGREDVRIATGFEAGGVAPFPLRGIETILIERTLLSHDVVWVGAGSSRHLASLAPTDLVRLARARPADVVSHNPRPCETDPSQRSSGNGEE
jgi:prolyl-tRNA editing enzyme YbaK/EbsC (Cys-tRNA(Pro) deacylase)